MQIPEELLKKQNEQKVKDLFSLLSTDMDLFVEKLADSKAEYYNLPIFTTVDLNKVYVSLVNAPTEKIIKIKEPVLTPLRTRSKRLAPKF